MKKSFLFHFYLIVLCILSASCRHTQEKKITTPGMSAEESPEDVKKALRTITGNISGKEVSDEELQDLSEQIRKDEKARSAIESVGGAISGGPVSAKYCPVDGEHFAPEIDICPKHNVELIPIED